MPVSFGDRTMIAGVGYGHHPMMGLGGGAYQHFARPQARHQFYQQPGAQPQGGLGSGGAQSSSAPQAYGQQPQQAPSLASSSQPSDAPAAQTPGSMPTAQQPSQGLGSTQQSSFGPMNPVAPYGGNMGMQGVLGMIQGRQNQRQQELSYLQNQGYDENGAPREGSPLQSQPQLPAYSPFQGLTYGSQNPNEQWTQGQLGQIRSQYMTPPQQQGGGLPNGQQTAAAYLSNLG